MQTNIPDYAWFEVMERPIKRWPGLLPNLKYSIGDSLKLEMVMPKIIILENCVANSYDKI